LSKVSEGGTTYLSGIFYLHPITVVFVLVNV